MGEKGRAGTDAPTVSAWTVGLIAVISVVLVTSALALNESKTQGDALCPAPDGSLEIGGVAFCAASTPWPAPAIVTNFSEWGFVFQFPTYVSNGCGHACLPIVFGVTNALNVTSWGVLLIGELSWQACSGSHEGYATTCGPQDSRADATWLSPDGAAGVLLVWSGPGSYTFQGVTVFVQP